MGSRENVTIVPYSLLDVCIDTALNVIFLSEDSTNILGKVLEISFLRLLHITFWNIHFFWILVFPWTFLTCKNEKECNETEEYSVTHSKGAYIFNNICFNSSQHWKGSFVYVFVKQALSVPIAASVYYL